MTWLLTARARWHAWRRRRLRRAASRHADRADALWTRVSAR